MLAAGGQAAYISEPLNVWHRPGVMGASTTYWYQYIDESNQDDYLEALRQTLSYNYHLLAEIRSLRSRKDFLRMVRDMGIFARGRLAKQRPLLKDPFAVFSAPWFAERLGCRVVITIRHPAAFASSLKRLDWPFDFSNLLQQPRLMQRWLEPFREEMLGMHPEDILGQGALLWRMVYQAVAAMLQEYPQFMLVRHEDLSLDPLGGYNKLYQELGLDFTARAEQAVLASSSSENPKELSKKRVHAVRLDSRSNLHNWKRRLSPEEIERIRRQTGDLAARFYPDIEWD
jgi:hypothetical protein